VDRKRLPLLALIGANAVSELGSVVAAVALPWFVLVTTGSPARTGVTAFFTTLPLALGAITGGAAVDRIGARRASVLADLGAGPTIAVIPLLHATGDLRFWHVLALAFLAGSCEAPGRAARQAMLPQLAERTAVSLERANSLAATTEHVGYVLGAPAAGVLIATLGGADALWVDAGSFVVSALVVARGVPAVRPAVAAGQAYVRDLADGLRFVREDATVRMFFVLPTIGIFLIGPLASVILPVYARDRLGGAHALAVAVAAYGAGGLLGALLFALAGVRVPRRTTFVTIWVVYPLLSLALVPLPRLALLSAILFLIGLLAGADAPLEDTIRQERIPAELRARVFALLLGAETLVIPPAVLLAGFLIGAAGLRASLVFFAVGNTLLATWVIATVRTHDLSGRPGPARPSSRGGRT
jgi:MFS family permease